MSARFTRMDESNRDEWMGIGKATMELQSEVPKRILSMLRDLEGVRGGFAVNQLHHALQTATMARRANASDEMVLVSLCHDIGKIISIPNHAAIAAEILKPYVSKDAYQVLRTHQEFQGRHYFQYFGASTTLRERHKDEPWFALAEQFTDEWDQAAFDPDYPVLPLHEFEPLVQQFFGRFPASL
ncbi:MAG: Metal-dependent phosphohydrolase, subdomain protein [Myxococcaceae bacterium]|nr:Metal-dependent phosphohydrolase, subdomain protein [Myxococcaceae bacterium]